MRTFLLATAVTENWVERSRPYFASIARHWTNPCTVVLLNCQADIGLPTAVLDATTLPFKNMNWCIQHGDFLEAFPDLDDEDVILFTDADMILQRSLTSDELAHLAGVEQGVFLGTYNATPGETLREEARLLLPQAYEPTILRDLDVVNRGTMINGGFLCARVGSWRTLREYYHKWHCDIERMFLHYARNQWLMSYIFNAKVGLTHRSLPDSLHSHSHFGLRERVTHVDGSYLYCGEPIAFFHIA